ncbi:hypothetical protein SASPL_156202 [Salvia splendens]|uniref:Uncharacterized protein n=1 Tax=Salvia splendens TaxID=180675 RepID=A0A8X8VX20_SALSN|nr:hypothetical protein SASPL_156202 [Salvia splendens]
MVASPIYNFFKEELEENSTVIYLDSPSPSPAPIADDSSPAAEADAGDIKRESTPYAADLDSKEDSTGGMSGGQKAGVAVGVITGAFVVGAGVVVYKKRQHNS